MRLLPETVEREPAAVWPGICTQGRTTAGQAIEHWRRAGEQSAARFANREAIGLLPAGDWKLLP